MKLIIAEKYNVATAIATAIDGVQESKDGYVKKGDYYITWASGHLLGLKEPEDYDPKFKKWNIQDLPFNFPNWELKPINASSKKQLNIIKDLLKECSSVIHACDPDDEGQLIGTEILLYINCKLPVERMLINDNNTEYIRKLFTKLEDNRKYESLGISAAARRIADAIIGINLSRFYSCKSSKTLHVGRVKAPTLGLVVNRDYAIENHIKQLHYILMIIANNNDKDNNITFTFQKNKNTPVNEDKLIIDLDYIENIQAEIANIKDYKVNVTSKILTRNPPLVFNIDKLQAYCNNKFSYTAQEVLEITQILQATYKIITYNRSDSQYLNEEHFKEAPQLIEIIKENLGLSLDNIDTNRKSKVFDSSKVTAHHGIIPTHTKFDLSKLNEKERNIYQVIAEFYLVQFMPPEKLKETTGIFMVKDHEFKTTGRVVQDFGYKKFLNSLDEEKENEEISNISKFEDGIYDFVNFATPIDKRETKPPKPYTEATLIGDMTSIAKYVKKPELKETLLRKDKDKEGAKGSIGTPATRASTVEDLIKEGYLERKGKQIRATEKGKNFYNNVLPDEIKTADLTALWWLIQEEIIAGTKTITDLTDSVYQSVVHAMEINKDIKIRHKDDIICPKCNDGFLKNIKTSKHNFWACSEEKCNSTFNDNKGKPDFTEKKPAEKSEIPCPKDGGILYKNSGEYGDYWRCGTCKVTYKDRNGTPDLSPKKELKKSGYKCDCGAELIERPGKKDPKKVWYGCSDYPKCKNIYFPQNDGSLKKAGNK
ncbi:MAG: topoisomerase DNA-binding C4 zinc finger domain-containing protein [Leptotrichiaceae bacterium]|nr:topoisomerase DNA-binding C4 zinc finger domain-containing protein [Leptotrichiaceae bacterium]